MIKSILFDFDGVLHNTFQFHLQKIREMTGIDICEEEYRAMHDQNFHFSSHNQLQGTDWTAYRHFVQAEQTRLKVEPHVKEVLLKLWERHMLFIVTSAGERNIIEYLKNNGLFHLFQEVLGFESCPSKVEKFQLLFAKYGLAPEHCLFVTDTLGDILEAHQVQLKTIAVDFGFHQRERLLKGNPLMIISNFSEIISIVQDLQDPSQL